MKKRAYIGLGSNLGQPEQQLRDAVAALDEMETCRVVACSRFWHTPPWGVLDQPMFVNAALALDTELSPQVLFDVLQGLERSAGRRRQGERWGPRTLDLDLLHVEGVTLSEEHLILPHPRFAARAFVLLPLADIAPELVLPEHGRVLALLQAVDVSGCQPVLYRNDNPSTFPI